jgi:hypothetical protein
MMSVGLLVITDGRGEYLERMLPTLGDTAAMEAVVVDDSGDPEYNHWLRTIVPVSWHVTPTEPRRGLTGALDTGWREMWHRDVNYVFHVEEDFTFPTPPPVADMIYVLAANPDIAQVVLKRQPWSPEEQAAGGIIECHPDDYQPRAGWVQHHRIFSLNPCLYPAWVMQYGAEQESLNDSSTPERASRSTATKTTRPAVSTSVPVGARHGFCDRHPGCWWARPRRSRRRRRPGRHSALS